MSSISEGCHSILSLDESPSGLGSNNSSPLLCLFSVLGVKVNVECSDHIDYASEQVSVKNLTPYPSLEI